MGIKDLAKIINMIDEMLEGNDTELLRKACELFFKDDKMEMLIYAEIQKGSIIGNYVVDNLCRHMKHEIY